MTNDHGWIELPGVAQTAISDGDAVEVKVTGATFAFAPIVDERRRCACTRDICQRPATQEDLRCDECRETCQ